MKKSFVIDSLKANNKRKIRKQQSKKQKKNKKKLFLIHLMQMNMQTNMTIIIIFTTFVKTIMIFTTTRLKYLILKNKFSTRMQALKTSILFHQN